MEQQTFTLDDLKRLERELAAMPKPPWTLIAPDGRAWQSAEPRELLAVLAGACSPLFPAGLTFPAASPAPTEEPRTDGGEVNRG